MLLVLTTTAVKFCVASIASAPLSNIKISIAIPVESLNIEDLDARDELNRPLHSTSEKSKFASLWMKSLNQRLLLSLTPIRLKMLDLLNSTWDGFAGLLSSTKRNAIRVIKVWFDLRKVSLATISFVSSSYIVPNIAGISAETTGNAFLFLLHAMITSIQILR